MGNKVTIKDNTRGTGSVTVDGVELDAISYSVEGGADELVRITVTFFAEVDLLAIKGTERKE